MMAAADNVVAVMKYNPGSEPERAPDLLETKREGISTRNDWEDNWLAEKSWSTSSNKTEIHTAKWK